MASKMMLITAIAAGVIVAGIAAAFAMSATGAPLPAASDNDNNGNSDSNTNQKDKIMRQLLSPSIPDAPALGNEDALVTIVEFGDYQCTWCHRWHQSTKDPLMADYVETGLVRFMFKDFPINDLSDRASSLAAEASYCAADQGKYWEYHDELYNNWEGENTGWVTREGLEQFAKNVAISDIDEFSDCLDSGKYSDVVRSNYDLARSIGLDATPSFIILVDGETPKLMRGAYPFSEFERVINEAYESS
ncbi:MAG TPA: DsbA family protein [Nitrososphaera sp.]|jgi:protein-disulfide isomerase